MDSGESHLGSLVWTAVEPSALSTLSSEWDELVAGAGYPAFMRAPFLKNAISTFGCAGGRLLLARRETSLVAGGVLVPCGMGRWSTYQPSQLPLGCWVMSRDLQWESILPCVLRELPGLPISVSFTQQDPHLVTRPTSDGCLETLDYVATGWVNVCGKFGDFWQARGKNLRHNLRKQRRRLEEAGNTLAFEFVDRPSDIDLAFLQFVVIENAGWKSTEGTSIAIENEQGAFYRAMLNEFAAQGAAFAIRLRLNGKPIAVDFGIRDSESLILLKTTYDENLREYSPAQLLHEQTFEYVFRNSSARRVEFYGRMMEWHSRWTEQSRMLFHVNVYRSPLLRRARDFVKWAQRRAQRARVQVVGD